MCEAKNLLKFENHTSLIQSPWRNYFHDVYHELPNEYPVCLADFDSFYVNTLKKYNLLFPKIYKNKCGPNENIVYWQHSTEPDWIIHLQRFKKESDKPQKSNTWLEVQHRSRSRSSGFEKNGMWFGVQSGTGIWVNLGKTIVFRYHHDAFKYFNASWENDMAVNAGLAGYDSIQFTACDGFTSPCCRKYKRGPCCTGFEFVHTRFSGSEKACMHPLRAGWNATKICTCLENGSYGRTNDPSDNRAKFINCRGFPSFQKTIINRNGNNLSD